MAAPALDEDTTTITAPDAAFLKQSCFEYTIPFGSDVNIGEEIKASVAERQSLDGIESRPWLFFDETVDLYLILRTSGLSQGELLSYLQRIVISVQAQVVNSSATDRAEAVAASELIYDREVPNVASPVAIVSVGHEAVENDDEIKSAQYTVWRASVFLTRPRIRLSGPSIVFTAIASLKPDEGRPGQHPHGYLESGRPLGLNLLESFARDPLLGGVKPRLSAVRVSRVAPITAAEDSLPIVHGMSRLSLNVHPALHTRVRFARPNAIPPSPTIIALLEMDFTPYFDCEVAINQVTLSMPDGQVENLNHVPGLFLPLNCVAHDQAVFMFRLAPQESEVPTKTLVRDVSISIECTALIHPGYCTPKLRMAWSTVLDFTLPVNPGFGSSVNKPFQRSHKPGQLSISDGTSFVAPSVSRPDSLPGLEALVERATEVSVSELGITMTFVAPEGPVYAGEEFVWNVFIVNRNSDVVSSSSKPAATEAFPPARKLALLAVPRRRRNDMRVTRPPSTATRDRLVLRRKSASAAAVGEDPEVEIADPVLDENIVHAMQRSSLVDNTEVVCLSADVRVGPLAPNACHVVDLRFLALKEGIVGFDCIRVVDLGSQEHVDVRDLPVMVVERRKE